MGEMIISACYLAALLVAASPPEIQLETERSTRIFIQTIPPGAKIILDGKPLGKSDALLLVPPGVRKIRLELDGYHPEHREVEAREGWITRLEFPLRPQQPNDRREGQEPLWKANLPSSSRSETMNAAAAPAEGSSPKPKDADDGASTAVRAWIAQAELPDPVRQAMQAVLQQHPRESRWSGRAGSSLFAVAAKRLPQGQVRAPSAPAVMELVHIQATHELLAAKSLFDQFGRSGLDDATTLRQAIENVAGQLRVTGNVQGLIHKTVAAGDFVVGYVVAEESSLSAFLAQPAELARVQTAYRDVMHRQARDLMDRKDWQNALLLWQHLHKRQLVSQQLYLDAARCFKELRQPADTVRVLSEALASFGSSGSPEFFEQAGDLALDMDTDEAQALAENAYRKASDALRETISGTDPADH
jgi:hypothetical protein